MMRRIDCRLRPMAEGDSARILSWRNQERVRANMFNDRPIAQQDHDRWFARALTDEQAIYRLFEDQGRALGVASLTGIDRENGRCHWGFYLGEADAPRGSGAAMTFMMLDEAFGPVGVRKVCGESFVFNARSVRLHERLGFEREGLLKAHYLRDGAYQDVVCMARFADGWDVDRATLMSSIFKDEPA